MAGARQNASRDVPAMPSSIHGRYRVERRIGRGAIGEVYAVVDQSTSARLAVKVLHAERSRDPRAARLRFRREFHTMAGLAHRSIVKVHEFGIDGATPYYTMELLDGEDLGDLGRVDAIDACRLLRDVASALAFLHARRLLHRDIAPRNVRRTSDGRAKLIDFGVLATMGVARDVAGTPPCIPPEAVRGLPLDARADLYGLGALAYWLLTGQHAYFALRIDELEEAWRRRAAPPSAHRSDVPPALDALVMSLLSLDPLGRPTSSAEVIDRLTGIGGLSPDPSAEVARGWLQSAAIVGRRDEITAIRGVLRDAASGSGRAVVVEAASGMGKSRLLREAALDAQLLGATIARAGSESAGRGPFGVVRELVRGLLEAAPGPALKAARPHIPVIGRAIAPLRELAPDVVLAPASGDPGEERVRMQEALLSYLVDLSRRSPIVLLVDDVQRCDEASTALLVALAHSAEKSRIVVIAALRTDEEVRSPLAVAALLDEAMRLRLRGLELADVRELVGALFGRIPHEDRVTEFMHRFGGGCPLHCTELARHLVDRGVVRYQDGVWTVSGDEIAGESVPRALSDAMDARVRSLGDEAARLAEALAVQGGELPLELCVALADERDEAKVFRALDELVFEEILVGADESYRFRHDGLREAVLRAVGDDRRAALHLRAAEALASGGDVDPEREAEVGWHFLRGGDRARAARYLERAGRRLYEGHSFRDAIGPLEAALAIHEQSGAPKRTCLEIRHLLMRAGVLCDREVLLRYANATIDDFRAASGYDAAVKIGRALGMWIGLPLGLAWASLRWLFTPPRLRGPTPIAALVGLIALSGYVASALSLSFHIERLREVLATLAPLEELRGRLLEGAVLLVRGFLNIPLGRWEQVRRDSRRAIEVVNLDRLTPLSEIDRRMAVGASYFMIATLGAIDQDPAFAEELEALEKLELRFFEGAAAVDRVFFHRLRGEEETALALEDRAEMLVVQLGNVWVFEVQRSWISAIGYGLTRDVLGLKRCAEALDRLIRRGYRLEAFAKLVRGEYLRERGDVAASRATLEEAVASMAAYDTMRRQLVLAALADTCLAEGDVEGARRAAGAALAIATDAEVRIEAARMRAERALALADAASGRIDEAERRLGELLRDATRLGSPSLAGSVHEARARVALLAGDMPRYHHEVLETEKWFRGTRNPALIARVERLAEIGTALQSGGAREHVVTEEAVTSVERSDPRDRVARALGKHRGKASRAAAALELLVEDSGAADGWLFVADGDRLSLVASHRGRDPTPDVVAGADVAAVGSRAAGPMTVPETPRSHEDGEGAWTPVVLAADDRGREVVVGVAALSHGPLPIRRSDPRLVDAIARALLEGGDVPSREERRAAPV